MLIFGYRNILGVSTFCRLNLHLKCLLSLKLLVEPSLKCLLSWSICQGNCLKEEASDSSIFSHRLNRRHRNIGDTDLTLVSLVVEFKGQDHLALEVVEVVVVFHSGNFTFATEVLEFLFKVSWSFNLLGLVDEVFESYKQIVNFVEWNNKFVPV